MSIQSAKRYGIDVKDDFEKESRLRRIEAELENKSNANIDAVYLSRGGAVPQVVGLAVVGSNPGTVTVAWSAVTISDLKRYEVRFSEDAALTTNVQTLKLSTTQYQFTTASISGGSGNIPLFVQVRAVNVAEIPGMWSLVLNTSTGLAQTDDIADDSVTTPKFNLPPGSLGNETLEDALALVLDQLIVDEGIKGPMTGLVLSRPSTATISISPGSFSRFVTHLSSALVKSINSTWVAGTSLGGLASGTKAPSTWYHVYFIRNSTTGAVDAGFDLSLTASTLLSVSGYNQYRFLGSIYLDSSSNIVDFIQSHETFKWKTPLSTTVYSTNPSRTARTNYTLIHTPLGIVSEAIVHAQGYCNTSAGRQIGLLMTSLNQFDWGAFPAYLGKELGDYGCQIAGGRVGANISFCQGEVRVMTDTLQRIAVRGQAGEFSAADNITRFAMRVHGFILHGLRSAVTSDTN